MASTRAARVLPALKSPQDLPRLTGFAERTTLFIVALKKGEATELLAGFAPSQAERARHCAQQLTEMNSATRQARLSHEFGPSPEFSARIHALLTKSPSALRAALIAHLPLQLRPAGAQVGPVPPILSALAARLVREARFG